MTSRSPSQPQPFRAAVVINNFTFNIEIEKIEADHCELTAVELVPNTITGLPPEWKQKQRWLTVDAGGTHTVSSVKV